MIRQQKSSEFLEPMLCSSGNCYELVDSQDFPWKICELRTHPQQRSTVIQYAELNEILIKETSVASKQKHFGDELYSLTFLITLRVSFPMSKHSKPMDFVSSSTSENKISRHCIRFQFNPSRLLSVRINRMCRISSPKY